jgi:hypothetical protein
MYVVSDYDDDTYVNSSLMFTSVIPACGLYA